METNFPRKYKMLLLCRQSFIGGNKLQSWPELLGHKGNKPVKMTYFLPPPPPDAMLMSGIQVIFGRLNIAWGKGGTKEMVY